MSQARAMRDVVPRVFVVEDDPTVSEVVVRYLIHEGFAAEAMGDGGVALERIVADPPDFLVLDIMLPTIDGLELCRQVREIAPIPIIMLTALGEESDRITGLELGADDYITKPFSPRELVARIRSVLRRASAPLVTQGSDTLHYDGLELDPAAHEVRVEGEPVALTAKEFDLLEHLMSHPRCAFSREDLLERVWGYTYGDRSTVTVHVRRLREKIERDPTQPRFVITVWGVGYRFDP